VQEVLFIMASEDEALPPSMSEAMGDSVSKLMRAKVDCGHRALWQRAAEVNETVRRWLEERAFE
jgi:soluble epoxide hydrolase/lipid-phosphate phosphatase